MRAPIRSGPLRGEQLKEWADRCGVDMIGGQEGSDPSAVVFDAVAAAKGQKV